MNLLETAQSSPDLFHLGNSSSSLPILQKVQRLFLTQGNGLGVTPSGSLSLLYILHFQAGES